MADGVPIGTSPDNFRRMAEQLCILTVHAHPDDEASKGASTIAKYQAEGIRTVLVCCTGGEEGDILNPAMDRPEIIENLQSIRRAELDRAAEIIGYDQVHMLGYRDSGMPDSEANAHPEAFANADLDEAVARLVAHIRAERPQVIVAYSPDQSGYQHPDHIRVNDISVPAFERACDANYRPDLGEPWTPSKLYYTVWSRERIDQLHAKHIELEIESPFERWFARFDEGEPNPHEVTTKVDTTGFYDARHYGLLAHETQVDPEEKFWFGLPLEVARVAYPYDDYELAMTHGEFPVPEDDLFAGLRGAQ